MASDAKTRRLDCGPAVDRISTLPRNLIDLILERVPVHDAARTSILSKTWRFVWGMHSHLVFDEVFFSQLLSKKDKQGQLSEVSETISNILLGHSGPILKFNLSIPPALPLNQCKCMDFWIKNISNNGVRKVELFNKTVVPYKIPSYLFSCLELTHLRLTKCILNPPCGFEGFYNLICVELVDVIITDNISFGIRLEELVLRRCTGIQHLGCQFKYNNNLSNLTIDNSGEIDWQWFECTQEVQTLGLLLNAAANSTKKIINLDKLVGSMPKIHTLRFDGFFLQFLEPGTTILKRLITTMENLKFLYLYSFGFDDLVQIKFVLCLIRSSPNLRYLSIRQVKSGNAVPSRTATMVKSLFVRRFLQLPNVIDMILDKLETVEIQKITWVGNSWAVLQFIKLLLASSPSLKRMKLTNNTTIDPKEGFRISRELMRFPRASAAAQIIWY